MITALNYHEILTQAGLPISGVTVDAVVYVNGWATGPSPEQSAQAAALLAAARPIELSAPSAFPFAQGCTVTVRAASDVQAVALLVRDQVENVALVNGVGALVIAPLQAPTLSPHIVVRAQNQAVFGYAQVVVIAE